MAIIPIHSSAGSYDVHCFRGALGRASRLIERLGETTGIFFVTSPPVWTHLGRAIHAGFSEIPRNRVILFDDAETHKDLATVGEICRALLRTGADRRSTIVAVGGGVVGDVAGFVAATYLRGVRLVHVPTTVVAQVDSSIGGKTGVNLPEGKNLVGAFYSPRRVITDPQLLDTLPHRQFRSGLYEVVKAAIIADPEMFEFLERRMLACLRRDRAALSRLIERCIRIKAEVVRRDEREGGLREILNFGHTLGHALEAATGYRYFLHGEAVAWGMHAATLLSTAVNHLRESEASRIMRLISSVGPLPPWKAISASTIRRILAGDKKTRGGRVRWVLARRIGKVEWGKDVPWPIVAKTLAALPDLVAKAAAR
jgi:3-dehydroquinate synthase